MSKMFCTAVATCLTVLPAYAMDWTGGYAGVLAGATGGGWRDELYELNFPYAGVSGGAFAGYRFNAGSLVAGVEASAMLSSMERTDTLLYNGTVMGMGALATARAVLGYNVGSALPYVSVGGVLGSQRFISGTAGFGRDEKWHVGLSLALGADIAVTETTFVRIEASYAKFTYGKYNVGRGDYTAWPTEQIGALMGVGFKF